MFYSDNNDGQKRRRNLTNKMRYTDLEYSTEMCADFAIQLGEVFELSEKQIKKLSRSITDTVHDTMEE